jgi:hypothetical protein
MSSVWKKKYPQGYVFCIQKYVTVVFSRYLAYSAYSSVEVKDWECKYQESMRNVALKIDRLKLVVNDSLKRKLTNQRSESPSTAMVSLVETRAVFIDSNIFVKAHYKG